MAKRFLSLITFSVAILAAFTTQAQIRDVPSAVKDAFTQQYSAADSVVYDDKLVYVLVHFNRHDSVSTARYTSKGIWQWTETEVPFTSIPEDVQDGFNKSKYLGWQVDHSYLVDLPGKLTRYKLQVEKNTVQKRNLYFNTRGRMISDNITMY